MYRLRKMKPVNRHLLVVPHNSEEKEETETSVLLPEGYAPKKSRYGLATVVDIAEDCGSAFKSLRVPASEPKVVIIDNSMIEEVDVDGKAYSLVLENYVVGILRGADEV